MYKYYSTYGVNWGEKSEDENLNPTPTNSNLLSQQFPQSTPGICRLIFKTAIASSIPSNRNAGIKYSCSIISIMVSSCLLLGYFTAF
jgi:hypothetical protein